MEQKANESDLKTTNNRIDNLIIHSGEGTEKELRRAGQAEYQAEQPRFRQQGPRACGGRGAGACRQAH